jgi:pimeloyl-ACP methyl ester carboxylesterase
MRTEMLKGGVADMIEAMSSLLPDVDKEAMTKNTEVGQYLVDSIHEGLKTGSDGWVDDDLSMIEPWGFELSEIKVPVILYQGTEDKMVPYAHGEWLAKHLPQEKLRKHLIQGQGHVSIFLGREDSIIDELLDILKV